MTVQEVINVRKSVRSYTGEPVSEEELKAIRICIRFTAHRP